MKLKKFLRPENILESFKFHVDRTPEPYSNFRLNVSYICLKTHQYIPSESYAGIDNQGNPIQILKFPITGTKGAVRLIMTLSHLNITNSGTADVELECAREYPYEILVEYIEVPMNTLVNKLWEIAMDAFGVESYEYKYLSDIAKTYNVPLARLQNAKSSGDISTSLPDPTSLQQEFVTDLEEQIDYCLSKSKYTGELDDNSPVVVTKSNLPLADVIVWHLTDPDPSSFYKTIEIRIEGTRR